MTEAVLRSPVITPISPNTFGDPIRVEYRVEQRTIGSEAMSLLTVTDRGTTGLRGGNLNWDGQLEDDARLVVDVRR